MMSERDESPELELARLLDFAFELGLTGAPEESSRVALRAAVKAHEFGNRLHTVEALLVDAQAKAVLGRYEEALDRLVSIHRVLDRDSGDLEIGATKAMSAALHLAIGKVDTGMRDLIHATQRLQRVHEPDRMLANAYATVGAACTAAELYEEADKLLARALEVGIACGARPHLRAYRYKLVVNDLGMANWLTLLGRTEDVDRYHSCAKLCQERLAAFVDRHEEHDLTSAYGFALANLDQADHAFSLLSALEPPPTEVPEVRFFRTLGLALCRASQGNLDDAGVDLDFALAAAQETRIANWQARARYERYRLARRRGDLDRALDEYDRYHKVYQQVFWQERQRRADAVDAKMKLVKLHEKTQRLQEQSESFRRDAESDALTGLYNRRYLDAKMAELIGQAEADQIPLSVAVLDVDKFKTINDQFSHSAGDAALQNVAEVLRTSVRDTDLVSRFAGDEFVVVFAGADLETATAVAERICAAVPDLPQVAGQRLPKVTVSIGVAEHRPGHSPQDTFHTADQALYEAKRAGGNQVVAASTDTGNAASVAF
jgi:diguanylate cyclase (GGDEF)-like protein